MEHDELLVGQCELLRSMVNEQSGASLLEKLPDLEAGLVAIRETLRDREALLHGHAA
jgi:hypothetical protein